MDRAPQDQSQDSPLPPIPSRRPQFARVRLVFDCLRFTNASSSHPSNYRCSESTDRTLLPVGEGSKRVGPIDASKFRRGRTFPWNFLTNKERNKRRDKNSLRTLATSRRRGPGGDVRDNWPTNVTSIEPPVPAERKGASVPFHRRPEVCGILL